MKALSELLWSRYGSGLYITAPREPNPDYDFKIHVTPSEVLKVECKLDRMACKTNNFAFEYLYRGKKSGIQRSFDVMLIGTQIGAPIYAINRDALIAWLCELFVKGKARKTAMGDGAEGFVVPMKDFLASKAVEVILWDDSDAFYC